MSSQSLMSVTDMGHHIFEIQFSESIGTRLVICSTIISVDPHGHPQIIAHNLTTNTPHVNVNVTVTVDGSQVDYITCSGNTTSTDILLERPQLIDMVRVPMPFFPIPQVSSIVFPSINANSSSSHGSPSDPSGNVPTNSPTASVRSNGPNILTICTTDNVLPVFDPSELIPVPGGFENCSGLYVPKEIEIILSYGPRFVPPPRVSFAEFVEQLAIVANRSEALAKDPVHYLADYLIGSYADFMDPLGKPPSPVGRTLLRYLAMTKTFLQTHPELVLVKSDKSKSLVLLSLADYREKMTIWIDSCVAKQNYQLMSDVAQINSIRERFFTRFSSLCGKLTEYRLLCRSRHDDDPYPRALHRRLLESREPGAPFPYLYGVIKTHKDSQPCRPICSTRKWYTYWIQKIINSVLSSALKGRAGDKWALCPQNVVDITKAATEIRNLPVKPGHVLVKFDIVDMYTSLDRPTILIILQKFVYSGYYAKYGSLPPVLIMECFVLCLSNYTLFTYDSCVYQQLRGLPQGACDSGLLATLVLDYMLLSHGETLFTSHQAVRWWKYMDDLLVYMPVCNVDSLRVSLEAATKLSFTVDYESVPTDQDLEFLPDALGCMPFLDTYIVRCPTQLYLKTYVKPMASLRMIHFHSSCNPDWKTSTVKNYVSSMLRRCSNVFLRLEFERLNELFQSNMYPACYTDPILVSELCRHIDLIQGAYGCGRVTLHHSLGDLVQRLRILRGHLELLRPRVTLGCSVPKVFRSVYDPLPNQRVYDISNRYICEDFVVALKRVYRIVGLGVPTHRNGPTLFEKLSMSLASPDPYTADSVQTQPLSSYIVKCMQCNTVFLLSGFAAPREILAEALDDPTSSISTHCRVLDHPPPRAITPTLFHGSQTPHITPAQQVTIMRLIYQYLGFEFVSVDQMQALSTYVLSGVLYALDNVPQSMVLSPASQ